jgi:predicted transcriptional regulator
MELASLKLDLAKKLFSIEDKELLNYLKAVLETQPSSKSWYDNLPDEIKESVDNGLAEAEKGQGIPHSEVMKSLAKWLKK